MSLKWRVVVRMIGFIISWVSHALLITLAHRWYSAISLLHQLQFTVAHALGFSVSTSRFPATDLDTQTVTVSLQFLHMKKIFQSHKSSHGDELSSSTSLHFTCNCHFQQRTHFRTDFENSCELVHILNWTAYSLSHKPWSLTCGIVYCCMWCLGGHVTPPYCCAIQHLQQRLETRGEKRSEGRGKLRSLLLCNHVSRYQHFNSSHMGNYAPIYFFNKDFCLKVVVCKVCEYCFLEYDFTYWAAGQKSIVA
jgi:hypothetical protein